MLPSERLDQIGVQAILKKLENGMSQSAIAQELGISRQVLHNWLTKNGVRELAREIAKEYKEAKFGVRPKCPVCRSFSYRNGISATPGGARMWRCSNCGKQFTDNYGRKGPPIKIDQAPNEQAQRMREYRARLRERKLEH